MSNSKKPSDKKGKTTIKDRDSVDYAITPIPKNFFVHNVTDVFNNKMKENHDYEQYFWTKETVDNFLQSIQYMCIEETCCFTTPSIAHALHENGRDEILLDIDKRFNYLPKFKYYNAYHPEQLEDTYKLLIIDPPFFIVPIEIIRDAVDVITNKDYSTCIIIAFLKRAEKRLRDAFKEYKLFPTTFALQYASIKPNKWSNFVLYSNVELPMMKRMKCDFGVEL